MVAIVQGDTLAIADFSPLNHAGNSIPCDGRSFGHIAERLSHKVFAVSGSATRLVLTRCASVGARRSRVQSFSSKEYASSTAADDSEYCPLTEVMTTNWR